MISRKIRGAAFFAVLALIAAVGLVLAEARSTTERESTRPALQITGAEAGAPKPSRVSREEILDRIHRLAGGHLNSDQMTGLARGVDRMFASAQKKEDVSGAGENSRGIGSFTCGLLFPDPQSIVPDQYFYDLETSIPQETALLVVVPIDKVERIAGYVWQFTVDPPSGSVHVFWTRLPENEGQWGVFGINDQGDVCMDVFEGGCDNVFDCQ